MNPEERDRLVRVEEGLRHLQRDTEHQTGMLTDLARKQNSMFATLNDFTAQAKGGTRAIFAVGALASGLTAAVVKFLPWTDFFHGGPK